MARYYTGDPDVFAVATLLGCEPAYGLAAHMTELKEAGRFTEDDPFGVILAAVCASHLERLARNAAELDRATST